MSKPFILEEKNRAAFETSLGLNFRLYHSLSLFRKMLPLSIALIFLSSAAPSIVRWYSGKFASGADHYTIATLWWIVGASIVFRIGAWMCFEMSGMWSAQDIHSDMVQALSHTRTTYFDENPSGRLINRLMRDFDEVRGTAIIFAGDLFNAIIEILSIAVVAAFANPFAGILIIPLFFFFSYIQYYRSSMLSHARRLSAVATSQVIARETDLIEGREIFLLYGKSKRLVVQMAKSFEVYARASLIMAQIEAWGSFWIRFTAEAFSFCVLLFLTYALARHKLDAAWTGVIISSLFGITGSIGWLDFATGLISRSVPHLERVFEIVDLPKEESEEKESSALQTSLPTSVLHSVDLNDLGDIVLTNYTMSYRKDSPVIVDNLSLTFKGGQRTALIGRTGSGKSSLIQSLFRMVYVRAGDISISGQSAFSTGIRTHRKRFAMIPQSPYLFEGTIHSNLDPANEIPETELIRSLEAVGLRFSLSHRILEEGKNLSQGERQLVCLARAMVSNKKIVVLDEATSGLDPETDARITQALKREFVGKTVITIAHRLDTIRDYDWVVELAQGKVVREGKPAEFLALNSY
jgi:ATP-binding cassette subfamily C (CFTR/MRP) protein 1